MRQFGAIVLLGLIGSTLVAATPFDQEKQNRDAECDNGCFFRSFPGGSCTNDAACMCTQQKYRERYFCCMSEKCDASVLPDSIQRQTSECEARNMPFTFDTEAVCGIKLSTKVSPYPTQTVTITATAGSSEAAATVTGATTTGTGAATIEAATGTTTEGASSVVTTGSVSSSTGESAAWRDAPQGKIVMGAAVAGVAFGMFVW
ncbi:hypothetical protein GCG54_00006781 [Colletotrichum gloeosporioides]|uniref:Extracellular membrane protein CFEM domain-containing protein n=1 Tax=Colletotrichum gloeosporioides TaxID=474922 RepID=A0A8H4CQA9_COLGL|nr:uncharacterized protein GCG54_00006781 [Colletotrichum gloeosporioides]KAF3808166.1 hypothetical protein GCG54_00006781 [Colletotrichum gloeosporioides]